MLSSFVRGLENLPRFVRLFHLDVLLLSNQRVYRQLLLSSGATDFLVQPMPHVLRVYLDLVRHLVDELLFPLAHDSLLIVIMTLNIQLLIKSVDAKFKVVELEEEFLQIEPTFEHFRHMPDLANLLTVWVACYGQKHRRRLRAFTPIFDLALRSVVVLSGE